MLHYKSLLMQFSHILWFLSLLALSFFLELHLLWQRLKSLILNCLIPQFGADREEIEKYSLGHSSGGGR